VAVIFFVLHKILYNILFSSCASLFSQQLIFCTKPAEKSWQELAILSYRVESDDESEGEEEEKEAEEEGQTVAEHVMPPAVLNNTVDKDEVPTVATLCDNNTDDGAKKVQEEPGVVEVEVEKAAGEEKQEFVPEKCADEAEAEIPSLGQCCESGSGIRIRRLFDPGSRIRNRIFLGPE
jgi:hypothetical protein